MRQGVVTSWLMLTKSVRVNLGGFVEREILSPLAYSWELFTRKATVRNKYTERPDRNRNRSVAGSLSEAERIDALACCIRDLV
jgi:hypothetical protein